MGRASDANNKLSRQKAADRRDKRQGGSDYDYEVDDASDAPKQVEDEDTYSGDIDAFLKGLNSKENRDPEKTS